MESERKHNVCRNHDYQCLERARKDSDQETRAKADCALDKTNQDIAMRLYLAIESRKTQWTVAGAATAYAEAVADVLIDRLKDRIDFPKQYDPYNATWHDIERNKEDARRHIMDIVIAFHELGGTFK